jgi:hypothetical protein
MTTEMNFVSESTTDQLVIRDQNDLNYCVNFRNLDSKITDLINNSNDTKLKEDWILTKSTLKYAKEKAEENKNEETLNKKRKRECEENFSIFDNNLINYKLLRNKKDEIAFVKSYPIYIDKGNITKMNLTKHLKSGKFVASMLNIRSILFEGQTKDHFVISLIDDDINKLRIAHETFYKKLDIIKDLLGLF